MSKTEGQIRINPYAVSPRRAIRLMADICSGKPDVSVEYERQSLESLVEKNFDKDWIVKNASNLLGNTLLFTELSKLLERLAFAVANDFFGNYKRVRVTVTGITSSGKSSLINFLMKRPDLLPVDPDPSTIIPTHIYCSNRRETTKAYAVNHRNAMIQVDLNAISGIQHNNASSTKSMERGLAEQISYAMSRFVVECPHDNFNDIEFIDSPGFNANDTDDAAALKTLEVSDVVLFLVDTTACMGKKDMDILNEIKKPVLLVANCNNKLMTRQDVVANFTNICESVQNFGNVIDCVCISSKKPDTYGFFSRSGLESMDVFECMENAINQLASKQSAHTEIDSILSEIENLLKDEAAFQNARQKKLELDRADINDYTTTRLPKYMDQKKLTKEVCEEVARVSNLYSVLKDADFYKRFCFLKNYYVNSEEEKDKQISRLFELHTKAIVHCTNVQTRLDQLYRDILDWYGSRKDSLGTDRIIASVRPLPKAPDDPFKAIDNVYDCEQEGLVAFLAEKGFDVLYDYNESGYSLLTYAAFRGNVPALQLIISSLGKDRLVRKTDREGRNILHAAADGMNISLFHSLKKTFPRLADIKDNLGRTPEEILQSDL